METRSFKILLILLLEVVLSFGENFTDISSSTDERQGFSKILSRRKRFLIFPDGSSFQLVFCAQNQGYLQVGDIVWFGNTAALAWELPSDPKLFQLFKKHDKLHTAENRDGVSKIIYYLDEGGKVISKKPYRKRPIVNPAFAKRSVDNLIEKPLSVKKLHEKQKILSPFEGLDSSTIDFHREGRKSLYLQLEKFIQAYLSKCPSVKPSNLKLKPRCIQTRPCLRRPTQQTELKDEQKDDQSPQASSFEIVVHSTRLYRDLKLGWSGKECILRLLCEAGRSTGKQGTFIEEILRVTFTLPSGREFDTEELRQYDIAHRSKGKCDTLYQQCHKS